MSDLPTDIAEEKTALTGNQSYEELEIVEEALPKPRRRRALRDKVPKKWQNVLTIFGVVAVLTAIIVTLYLSSSSQNSKQPPSVPVTPRNDSYDEPERVILEEFFAATNGYNWTQNTNWMSQDSICNWFGVWCDYGQIRSLSLAWNNLYGTLPASIGSMPTLRQINLPFNKLYGTIPKEIGNSSSLRVLVLSFNNLTGVLPTDELTGLKLQSIRLKGNALTGELPVDFIESVELYFDLATNDFYGTLPDLRSDTLSTIRVGGNRFTGTLPILPPNLSRLSLDQNMFVGDTYNLLPLKGIQRLDLSGNDFTGELMLAEEQFARLEYLNIANNSFTSVRASNVTLVKDFECYAENVGFTCPIPDWLRRCSASCKETK